MRAARAQLRLLDTGPRRKSARSSIDPAVRIVISAKDSKWEASLPPHDGTQPPAIHQLAGRSAGSDVWELVHGGKLERMSHVIVREPIVEMPVERVGAGIISTHGSEAVQLFGPCIVRQHGQAVAQALFDGEPETVVM